MAVFFTPSATPVPEGEGKRKAVSGERVSGKRVSGER